MAFIKGQLGCQNRPSQYKGLPRVPSRWTYATTDLTSIVTNIGYFNNAYSQGMRGGDEIALGCIEDGSLVEVNYILGVTEVEIEGSTHFSAYIKDIGVLAPLKLFEPFIESSDVNTGINVSVCPTDFCIFNILWKITIDGKEYLVTADARKIDIVTYADANLNRTIRPIGSGGNTFVLFEVWVDGATGDIHFGVEDINTNFTLGEYSITLTTV